MKQNTKKDNNLKKIADIIQSQVGFFNGWLVADTTERLACEKAAKRIINYLKRYAKIKTTE